MDSRDLVSSSSMTVAREGADEDGILSATALLAKEASVLYQTEKFAECIDVLNQLLQKKKDDPKILHNIVVAEFARDGCSEPKKLIEVLLSIMRKSEGFACAPREQTDGATQACSKAISGAKGTNNLANNASVVFADEFDASVAALNVATVLFHLHEYQKALSVLDPLFQNIEPIDETTALHICLLLLDVAYVTQDASKFLDVINYLEKASGISYVLDQGDSGIPGKQQSSNLVMKSSSIPNNSLAPDDLNSEVTGIASESTLSRTFSDETMEYETLLSTLDISGQNISRQSNLSRTPTDRSTPTINLKLQLPLYKIQLLLLTRNLKAAKREVKLAMNVARGIDSSRALLLKSQLEYARGNYPKAFKLLRASSNQSDVGSSIIINNNIGCIYYQQGKHHISSMFFHKALKNCSSLWKEKPRKLVIFSQDKSLLIAYNCGVQYLTCGKPILAARCFMKASLVFYNRPLLWLRLAECCLMALENGLSKPVETPRHEPEVKVQVIGQGKWRQLAMENGSLSNGHEKEDLVLDCNGKPKLSMSFARQCLLNALHLLESSELRDMKSGLSSKSFVEKNESSEAASLKNADQVSANGDAREHRGGTDSFPEYEDICRREKEKIKQAILTDLAFVELQLGNPMTALSKALSLLKLPECSRMYAFLGHVYAAEALCLLNRPMEASEHLSTYLSGGNNVELPYSEEDCRQWLVKITMDVEDLNTEKTEHQNNVFLSPEEARGALYVNLASMYAIQGDLEQASLFATRALATAPNSQQAAIMAVYLDLKLGNSREALAKLKRYCRVRFLPFSSRSKASS